MEIIKKKAKNEFYKSYLLQIEQIRPVMDDTILTNIDSNKRFQDKDYNGRIYIFATNLRK